MGRPRLAVSEVAAPATRDANLLGHFGGVVDQQDLAPQLACDAGAEQASRTGPDHHGVESLHRGIIATPFRIAVACLPWAMTSTLSTSASTSTAPATWAVRVQFFVAGVLFATWGVHVPTVKAHYALG